MSERVILKGLKGSDFQHPEDKIALDSLEKIPLLNTSLEAILKNTSEAMMKFVKAGSCIEINKEQYSSVYNIFLDCCKILDIEKIPKLYLEGKRGISANVDGITEPIVLISEGAVEVLSEDELHFLLGHALGHIKAGHELYHKVAELILEGWGELLGNIALPVKTKLLSWYRVSVLSADRAGALCCQSNEIAISVLAKLAGFIRHYNEVFNIESFIIQARNFKQQQKGLFNSFLRGTHYFFNSVKIPLTILRTTELVEWIESGEYEKLVNRGILEKKDSRNCPNCGYEGIPSGLYVCPKCKTIL